MSKLIIPSHLTLGEDLRKEVFDSTQPVELEYRYKSKEENCEKPLVQEYIFERNFTILTSETNEWNPQVDDLICEGCINFNNSKKLFGLKGIVKTDSTIGIAVKWSCRDTKTRGTVNFNELNIKKSDDIDSIKFKFTIAHEIILGLISFEFIIFLKEPDKYSSILGMGFPEKAGTILGTIYQTDIMVDGNGPLFPIKFIEKTPQDNLWDVVLDVSLEDLMEETFDENVMCIYINQNHKNVGDLQMTKEGDTTQLFKEIIAQSIFLFVESIRHENVNFLELLEEEYEPGSVGFFLQYLQNNCNCDFSSMLECSKTIRRHAERNC
jgi:hypothetical protein